MKKRIVKEIYRDGTITYRIEKHGIFGWSTQTKKEMHMGMMFDTCEPIRFSTLQEAETYCKPIVKEEIIEI